MLAFITDTNRNRKDLKQALIVERGGVVVSRPSDEYTHYLTLVHLCLFFSDFWFIDCFSSARKRNLTLPKQLESRARKYWIWKGCESWSHLAVSKVNVLGGSTFWLVSNCCVDMNKKLSWLLWCEQVMIMMRKMIFPSTSSPKAEFLLVRIIARFFCMTCLPPQRRWRVTSLGKTSLSYRNSGLMLNWLRHHQLRLSTIPQSSVWSVKDCRQNNFLKTVFNKAWNKLS